MSDVIYELSNREESTMVSNWTIYLCIREVNGGMRLSHMQREVIGQLADYEEYDEEGELISDDLPDQINGDDVFGVEDESILGYSLVDDEQYESMVVSFASSYPVSDIAKFLEDNDWDMSINAEIQSIWRKRNQ